MRGVRIAVSIAVPVVSTMGGYPEEGRTPSRASEDHQSAFHRTEGGE
jgi:hypothetical protein